MSLREELLRLLREDLEFRYAVLGYLGLDEVIKSIESLQEQVLKHTKAIESLQQQVASLQQQVRSLQEQVASLQQQVGSLQQQVRSLQEQVLKHTKAIESLQQQVGSLQQQVRSLQEQVLKHTKVLTRHAEVLERHTKVLEEHTEAIRSLEGRVTGLTSALIGIRHALGISLEEFAREFLKGLLEARGIPRDKLKLERKVIRVDGKEIEVNIFNEDPLVVGEVTSIIEDVEEVNKVIERVRAVEKVYGRKPSYVFLIAPTIWKRVFRDVIRKVEENEIELIYGRVA